MPLPIDPVLFFFSHQIYGELFFLANTFMLCQHQKFVKKKRFDLGESITTGKNPDDFKRCSLTAKRLRFNFSKGKIFAENEDVGENRRFCSAFRLIREQSLESRSKA